jgi:hypothetical protein
MDAVQRRKRSAEINDDDFCVSITRAADLSGLTESQIRYLDALPNITIGKRRPNERNRVYSKQDVLLLRWIYEQGGRPSDVIDRLNEGQETILRDLGHLTLQQVLDDERSVLGHDVLVSRLVTVLLSIWRESMQEEKVKAVPLGVIFGPQDESWKTSFRDSCRGKSFFDLAGSLVVWSAASDSSRGAVRHPAMSLRKQPGSDTYDTLATPDNLSIMYSRQSWYLPFNEQAIIDTSHFESTTEDFAIAILWQPVGPGKEERLSNSARVLDKKESKRRLTELLMKSLKAVMKRSGRSINVPMVVYLRSGMGEYAAEQCLSLLLNTCILPYFSKCYCYAGKFGDGKEITFLVEGGKKEAGYLAIERSPNDYPWWVHFVHERAGVALAKDVYKSVVGPLPKGKPGSAVCFPLMALERVVGVFGIELIGEDVDCLTAVPDYEADDVLRYLICISEIAAEYLSLMESSVQKSERSRVAYVTQEVVNWWLNIYNYGGSDYARIAQEVYAWLEGKEPAMWNDFCVLLIDVHREAELTAKYQGVEVLVHIMQKLKARLKELVKHDPIAASMSKQGRLTIFDEPVGDHLLFAETGLPREFCSALLEQIRNFWSVKDDMLAWKRTFVEPLHLQVGICHFSGLADYNKEMGAYLINYHLKKMAQHFYTRNKEKIPLQHVFEYEAQIVTEKMEK